MHVPFHSQLLLPPLFYTGLSVQTGLHSLENLKGIYSIPMQAHTWLWRYVVGELS